jgi:putative ABC transport system permease protein
MFLNYLKIAWRSLLKNKLYSLLNIMGLAIGLSCFLLIVLYVADELAYDRFHEKADRIYRINSDLKFGDTFSLLPFTSDMMGPTLKQEYPQVEEQVRIYTSSGSKMLKKGAEFITESDVAHADSTIFRVFTLPLLAGDPHAALAQPNSVVISESAALKYFGTAQALGQVLETITGDFYEVRGVMEDMPENGHFKFDFIFSMSNAGYEWGSFLSHNFHTYLLLQEGVTAADFRPGLLHYITNYVLPQAKQLMGINSIEEFEAAGNKLGYWLTPITDIHLYSDREMEIRPGGSIQYVYIFSAVALFILLIACVNFMNLSTASSAGRAREVGIRKVLGSERRQLMIQFLTEASLMALLAMGVALLFVLMALPLFNELAAKALSLQRLLQPDGLLLLLALPLLVGLLAGAYPAFFLSAFKPIHVLKGKLNLGASGGSFRSVLVVFQFTISIILIIGTLVVYRQLAYIQNKQLGFNKDQVLIVNDVHALKSGALTFKNEVVQLPGVQSGTLSGFLPVASNRSDQTYSKVAAMSSESGFGMQTWWVDPDYIPTLGMELLAGRNFSPERGGDSTALIINESTARLLGYDDPVGKTIWGVEDVHTGRMQAFDIIGVVKNFHYETLRQNIGPLTMRLGKSTSKASFKVKADQLPLVIAGIDQKWKSMAPGIPLDYRFLDDAFDAMYRTEQRLGRIALVFSLLAIAVACLGLFGLSTFIAQKRAKEIGIRKVLGASVGGLVQLLSLDFIKLVAIAFLIASPLAWWAMHSWLQDFAYRIDISWWIFIGAGLVALLIALATVSVQALKAAMANPVNNLRTE